MRDLLLLDPQRTENQHRHPGGIGADAGVRERRVKRLIGGPEQRSHDSLPLAQVIRSRPAAGTGVAAPAARPAIPIRRCSKLSSVLTGMIVRIESPSPTMKPQIATTM